MLQTAEGPTLICQRRASRGKRHLRVTTLEKASFVPGKQFSFDFAWIISWFQKSCLPEPLDLKLTFSKRRTDSWRLEDVNAVTHGSHMGNQSHSMLASRRAFISFMVCTPALWVRGNLEQGLWQAEKHLACFQSWYGRARRSSPVLHLFPVAFRYAQPNLFIQGSLAPLFCGCPHRQTGGELFTSSHTHPHIGVVGCGQGDAWWDRSFRRTVPQIRFRQTLRKKKEKSIKQKHTLFFRLANSNVSMVLKWWWRPAGWTQYGIQIPRIKVWLINLKTFMMTC